MNPEYKARWLEGLRDGTRKQGKTNLKRKLDDGSYEFCCLGVAAELFSKELELSRKEVHGVVLFDGISAMLSHNFRDVLYISTNTLMKMAEMNDKHGKSFLEIADWLEANE